MLALPAISGMHFIPESGTKAALPETLLEESDILFRSGDEPVSAAIRAMSHGVWSHVGLVTQESGQWMVVHALPSGSEGKSGGVLIEPIVAFLAHAENVALFREQHAGSKRALSQRARRDLGRPFGIAADETYCTRFIIDIFAEAGMPLSAQSRHYALFGTTLDVVLPQALAESPTLRRIY